MTRKHCQRIGRHDDVLDETVAAGVAFAEVDHLFGGWVGCLVPSSICMMDLCSSVG